VIVGSPGGATVEELLSQLPEDVIGSGRKKEDPGRAPSLPLAFHLQGGRVTGCQQRGVCEAYVCVVSEAMKIYVVIFWVRTLLERWVSAWKLQAVMLL
jgi:hypothetical protein